MPSGQKFCKNFEDGWEQCRDLSSPTTPSGRRVTTPSVEKSDLEGDCVQVVPALLPFARLATERSNFTETERVDLTTVYYGPPPLTPSRTSQCDVTSLGECCTVLAELGFQSSLPVVIIETGGEEIPDEPKMDATMCTCGSEGQIPAHKNSHSGVKGVM